MKKLLPILFLAFLPAVSCERKAPPNQPAPQPLPTVPAPDGGAPKDVCERQCENEKRLGCPEWRPKCVEDCRAADWNLQKMGSAPLNHACVAVAASCEAARQCR